MLRKTLCRVSKVTLPPHESDKALADQFASFFHNKIKTIADTFIPSGTEKDVHPSSDPPKITAFTEVPHDTVDKIIRNSPMKSCLLYPWPTFLIKECSDILLLSITKLGNCSLMEACVSDGFKTAVVSPCIKKNTLPADDFKNYCPVYGLSFISNLVERVVAKQLLEHIHVHNLDNPYQSAYKTGDSTEAALLSIKNEIHLQLTALILLDLSAALDKIDHSTLLHCLQTWFGIGGSVLKWFTSYLSESYQSIKIGSAPSDLCKLLFGVPQGSVLGPLLFSLYTTPLSLVIGKHKGVKFHCYADDTHVYMYLSQKNSSAAFEKLNRCLDDIKERMSASKLKLNPEKTEFIIFGSKRQRDKLKHLFHLPSWVVLSALLSLSRIWVCGSILIFLDQTCSECLQKLFCATP